MITIGSPVHRPAPPPPAADGNRAPCTCHASTRLCASCQAWEAERTRTARIPPRRRGVPRRKVPPGIPSPRHAPLVARLDRDHRARQRPYTDLRAEIRRLEAERKALSKHLHGVRAQLRAMETQRVRFGRPTGSRVHGYLYDILAQAAPGRLHYTEILRRLAEDKHYRMPGKNAGNNLRSRLCRADYVRKYGHGLYGLRRETPLGEAEAAD